MPTVEILKIAAAVAASLYVAVVVYRLINGDDDNWPGGAAA